MPDTDQTSSAPHDDESDKVGANETTKNQASTADDGSEISDEQKGALAAEVADPDSDASLT